MGNQTPNDMSLQGKCITMVATGTVRRERDARPGGASNHDLQSQDHRYSCQSGHEGSFPTTVFA